MTDTLAATLEAITILQRAYDALLRDDAPQPIRLVVLRARDRLSTDARRMLTGE